MVIVFYTYFLGPSSVFYKSFQRTPSAGSSSSYTASSWGGDALKNRVFFTFMFLEMISWFWIWVTLREERHELVAKIRKHERSD